MKLDTTNRVNIFYFSLSLLLLLIYKDYSTHNIDVPLFNQSISHRPPPSIDPNAKYLTFFTHSGFQNQLIQVENAISLAWFLNRTLILPKAILGDSFGWNHFDRLQHHHNIFAYDCKNKKSCRNKRFALVNFEDLIDLSWAKRHVKIINKDQPDLQWLRDYLNIETECPEGNGTFASNDVLFFKDKTRYDWRFFDKATTRPFMSKYLKPLFISELKERNEKLIYFTSLFGTGKFSVKLPHHQHFLKTLKQTMVYKHPAVLKTAKIVIDALGGPYVGVHLRTGDGLFTHTIAENIQQIKEKIRYQPLDYLPDLSSCVQLAHENKTTLVFLATDAVHPRKNTLLVDIWNHAPCTFTLDDIAHVHHPSWIYMDQYRVKGESIRKYLVPLVDALVASQGRVFIGSKGSTFSGYIRRLHQIAYS
ncbi:hypothetical protein BY458DRAFT_539491 [Sporodiniella umbellata]|nr:hypothetical protein BY458DRAFT_539491 [Sporodiniella umbellata]